MLSPEIEVGGGDDQHGPRRSITGAVRGCLAAVSDDEALQQHYMVEHLSTLGTARTGTVFSMPLQPQTSHTLSSILRGLPPGGNASLVDVAGCVSAQPGSRELHEIGFLDHPPEVGQTLSNTIFWKIINKAPSRIKRPRLSDEFSLGGSFVVSLHRVLGVD
eukprot:510862-Heterocapsa_arctica.AAC.1